MQRMWFRLGRVASLPAVLTFYVVAVPVGLLLHDPVDATLGLVLFVVFIVYCFARPHHGRDVFLYAAAPGAIGTILHDVFDISRLWGLLFVVVVLPALREIDRERVVSDRADDAAPSAQVS